MAGRAPALALVHNFARGGIPGGLFLRASLSQPPHKSHESPHIVLGRPHRSHLGALDSVAYGLEQLSIRSPVAVLSRRQVRPASAFSIGSVAVRAVGLK